MGGTKEIQQKGERTIEMADLHEKKIRKESKVTSRKQKSEKKRRDGSKTSRCVIGENRHMGGEGSGSNR